jgi:hypothetical protein
MDIGGTEPEQSGDGLTDSISNIQAIRRSLKRLNTYFYRICRKNA